MKLTIKESFKSERCKPETIFWVCAKIYEELIKKPMKWTILGICAMAGIASPSECFLFRAELWMEIIWKIGLKHLISSFTFKIPELNLELELSSFELTFELELVQKFELVQDFELN